MHDDATAGSPLRRDLAHRHIQLIAIGGAIGTGLFLGAGKTISLAGPSVILVYAIIGFFLFFVLRAMGEVLLSDLRYKSFSDVAADLLGPWAGFFTGWTYWFCWVVTGIADVVAISGYVAYWWADVPLWIPALACILVLFALNLPTVRAFGEAEFWFALVKIVAILALVVVGLAMVLGGFRAPDGTTAAFANLWNDGGFFPTGVTGFVAGFQIAVFAFVGVELVGTTAAEARDPERTLPRAINTIPVRILLFYVGALVVICAVTPWSRIAADESPFVAMFGLAGLAAAAGVVNFVVLTSALSSANSGIYSTSRMVYGLAGDGAAPPRFARLSARRVPVNALAFSCAFLLVGVALLYSGQSVVGGVHRRHDDLVGLLRVRVDDDPGELPGAPQAPPAAPRGVEVPDAGWGADGRRGAGVLRVRAVGADPAGRHPGRPAGDADLVRRARRRLPGAAPQPGARPGQGRAPGEGGR